MSHNNMHQISTQMWESFPLYIRNWAETVANRYERPEWKTQIVVQFLTKHGSVVTNGTFPEIINKMSEFENLLYKMHHQNNQNNQNNQSRSDPRFSGQSVESIISSVQNAMNNHYTNCANDYKQNMEQQMAQVQSVYNQPSNAHVPPIIMAPAIIPPMQMNINLQVIENQSVDSQTVHAQTNNIQNVQQQTTINISYNGQYDTDLKILCAGRIYSPKNNNKIDKGIGVVNNNSKHLNRSYFISHHAYCKKCESGTHIKNNNKNGYNFLCRKCFILNNDSTMYYFNALLLGIASISADYIHHCDENHTRTIEAIVIDSDDDS